MAMFLMALATGSVGLVLPLYASSLGATYTEIGLIATFYVIFDTIFSVPSGIFGDKHGRRLILAAGFLLTSLTMMFYSLAIGISAIFLLRLIQGATEASIWTNAQAAVADLSSPSTRGRAIGLFGASWGIGFGIGPAVGGFLYSTIGPGPTFLVSGLSALASTAIVSTVALPPPVSPRRRPAVQDLLPMCFAAIVYVGILAIVYTILPVYAVQKLRISEFEIGMLITGFSVLRGILFMPLGKLSDLIPSRTIVLVGIIGAATAAAAIAFSFDAFSLAISLLGLGVAEGLTYPAVASKISKIGGKGNFGYVLGIFNGIAMIGWGTFPGIGGVLADAYGSASPFLMCSVFGLSSTFLLFKLLKD